MADEKEKTVPNVNVFNDAQVILLTQAIGVVAAIITRDKPTYKIALKAFKSEMKRRGVHTAADEMNNLMKLGSVVGKRLGYEVYTGEPQFGHMED